MAEIIDKRFKDADPVDTVNRIKEILNRLGIQVEEEWTESGISNCYSLRVNVKGTALGTNGKGITKEFAAASGYAEFMERLQPGYLLGGTRNALAIEGKPTYPDAVFWTKDELVAQCGCYLEAVKESSYLVEKLQLSTDEWADVCVQREKFQKIQMIPFYSVFEDKNVMVPIRFVNFISGSNGLAAGNTMEEAVVEGFSEIVERYNKEIVVKNGLIPPTVPEEYLKQFVAAYETITELRNAGYDVMVKDFSLGGGYPVIATVVIDKKSHTYHIHVGASPVFEIALQRSLTEMFQGREIKNVAKINKITLARKKDITLKEKRDIYAQGVEEYPIEFFDGEPSYAFTEFEDRSNCSNKDLSAYVLKYIRDRGKQLLIRDYSFLGFNTYRIIVPGMSEILFHTLSKIRKDAFPLLSLSVGYGVTPDVTEMTQDELFDFKILNCYRVEKGVAPRFSSLHYTPAIGKISDELYYGNISLAYAQWECWDRVGACKFAKMAERFADEKSEPFITCICMLTNLYDKNTVIKELNQLSRFFDAEVIEMLKSDFINEKNPFERFALKCSPKNCNSCKQKEVCTFEISNRLYELIVKATFEFDNEVAFERLRKGFNEIKALGI